jgi:hypothetical protein
MLIVGMQIGGSPVDPKRQEMALGFFGEMLKDAAMVAQPGNRERHVPRFAASFSFRSLRDLEVRHTWDSHIDSAWLSLLLLTYFHIDLKT